MNRTVPPLLLEVAQSLQPHLQALQSVALPHAYLAAGMVRNRVWQRLFGGPLPDTDWDVAFVGTATSAEATAQLHAQLAGPWEAENQQSYGHASVAEALASWPETATGIGVRLVPDGLEWVAPWGFEDLMAGVVRRSPRFSSEDRFAERSQQKRWSERWSQVRFQPWREQVPDLIPITVPFDRR